MDVSFVQKLREAYPISLSGTRLRQVTRPTLLTNPASTCRVLEVLVRQLLHLEHLNPHINHP
jgi:hypothetical protein